MRLVIGLLALAAVSTLTGCAALNPARALDGNRTGAGSPMESTVAALVPGSCVLAGTVYTCAKLDQWVPTEGVVLEVYCLDAQGNRPERAAISVVTDRLGHYALFNLPAAEYPLHVLISASYKRGQYEQDRVLCLGPLRRTVCDFRLCESSAGSVTVVGNTPDIDPTKAGGGAILTRDPRTGEPTYHPY